MSRKVLCSAAALGAALLMSSTFAVAEDRRPPAEPAASFTQRQAAHADADADNQPTSYDFESYGVNRMNSPG